MKPPRIVTGVAGLLAGLTVLAGCAPTVYDTAETRPPKAVATTTTLPTGTPAALVGRLAAATVELSEVIQAQGDVATAIGTIDNLWAAVQQDVGRARPEMLAAFEAEIRLADRAARLRQLGYAIKAGQNMSALAAAFGS